MILSKLKLVENILTEISDNSTGQISPYDIRHNLLDTIDSVHLLLNGKSIQTSNFATPSLRTTKGGENTLENIDLNGYSTVDNSAFGFSALKANYQGSRNTAIGSLALGCNIYGEDNVAVGYVGLGGNINGSGNVGIGNYSLNNNAFGNLNIAIGHGAGYYVDRLTSNKLFIASHPVHSGDICGNPDGIGLIPLVYGDLLNNKFGINVTELDSSGTLQVGGDISPSVSDTYNIGNSSYRWNDVYASTIKLNDNITISNNSTNLAVNTNIVQNENGQSIGTLSTPWSEGYFDNIYVNGIAFFGTTVTYDNCHYTCKNIYLASTGCDNELNGCILLEDYQMHGAGLIASTSGNGLTPYRRNYQFTFSPPASGMIYDTNPFAKAAWNSNISLNLSSSVYLKTNRIVSYDVNGHGLFFDNGKTYIGRKNILDTMPSLSSGTTAGVGNINFFSNYGLVSNYIATIGNYESGVSVSHRLLSRIKNRTKDLTNNKDKLTGFEFKFIDTAPLNNDRLVIGSYNNTSYTQNSITIMKNGMQGILGINNLGVLSESIIPQTTLDIRSSGDAIIRNVAENYHNTISALQLFGKECCEYDGFEACYYNNSGIADLSLYIDAEKQVFFRLYDDYTVGLFNSGEMTNAMFTLGDNVHTNAAISLKEFSGSLFATETYGKIYVQPKLADYQVHSLYFKDGDGNVHDLVTNKYDVDDGRVLFTDPNGNTFGGIACPNDRKEPASVSYFNTAVGNQTLNLLYGGKNNCAFGANAGKSITTGSKNTIIGSFSAVDLETGTNNIIIGNDIFNNTLNNTSNNIIIGNSGLANGHSSNYQLYIGSKQELVLLHGILGPTQSDKKLTMPSGGAFYINDSTNSDALGLQANIISILDYSGNDYPDNSLKFRFTGNESNDLLTLKHHVEPLPNIPYYDPASNTRPHAELNGDLRIQGSIRFSDNTSLASSSEINNLTNSVSTINSEVDILTTRLNDLIVEGTCSHKINKPSNPSLPTFGNMIVRNTNWQDTNTIVLKNRDTNLEIPAGSYVVAIKINNEYRPIRVSSPDAFCSYCNK
ncbi:hypothetical protein EB001_03990 [bacterium]|nr:hypothetical protein [bacterium]